MTTPILIVGAGPAGATAARTLAAAGVPVHLLDRSGFPRNKPCGGGISARVLTRFPYLGSALTRIATHTVARLHLEGPDGHSTIIESDRPAALMIRRVEYDALLVSRTDSRRVLLGTQHGLFATTDGGRSWKPAGLRGRAITSLGQVGRIILVGGPQVFASSDDGGQTWRSIHPRGLPSENVLALATSPNRSTVYVLLLGAGLYRSTDKARSFTVVSPTVGPAIRALALTSRHVIAGDISTGVYISLNGQDWLHTARGMIMALAVGGAKHKQVLAASWGISPQLVATCSRRACAW